jgi:hypothetical protein
METAPETPLLRSTLMTARLFVAIKVDEAKPKTPGV